jgi:hypothetical protein
LTFNRWKPLACCGRISRLWFGPERRVCEGICNKKDWQLWQVLVYLHLVGCRERLARSWTVSLSACQK